MLLGAHLFVGAVFTLLGVSFLITTVALIAEFWDAEWFTLAALHSHLFLFFPIFGIAALIAFYLPSVVFVDMYWRHTRFGKLRFGLGMLVVMALALLISNGLLARPGSWIGRIWYPEHMERQHFIWEVKPELLLKEDEGEPKGCTGFADRPCNRMSALAALRSLRNFSDQAHSLTNPVGRLTRECVHDPVIEYRNDNERRRLCLAASAFPRSTRTGEKLVLMYDEPCCTAQRSLARQITLMQEMARSNTSRLHERLLPLKTFFLLVLLVISVLLAVRYKSVVAYYSTLILKIELSVLTGVMVTLPFPFMGQAYKQASEILFGPATGPDYRNAASYFSVAFGIWALLILIFFYRRRDKQAELLGRMGSGAVAGLAALNYDRIVSVFVRYAGVGADFGSVLVMLLLAGVPSFWLVRELFRWETTPVGE